MTEHADRIHRDAIVRLSDLTLTGNIIEAVTFTNCLIVGPAVILILGATSLEECSWDAPGPRALFWEIDDARSEIVGAVGLLDCTFSACRFTNVGIGAHRKDLPKLQAGFGL